VKYGQKSVRKAFRARKVQSDSTKTEIDDTGAMSGLVAENCVGVGSCHGDAFCFAWHSIETALIGNNGERRLRSA
jgi:hypothetical protein